MKKVIAFLLCITVFVGSLSFSVFADNDSSDFADGDSEYVLICENKNLSLFVNTYTADFYVTDKRNGKIWTAVSDSNRSLLNIAYSGENNLSIQKDTDSPDVSFELYQLDNGIKTVFIFNVENSKFKIPVKTELKEDSIRITVIYNEIVEKGAGKILEISPYPYFGMGKFSDDGYAFIPDGSGSIIDYKDIISKDGMKYCGRIYGDDPSENLIYDENGKMKTALLPVFGAKNAKNAIFGIIEKCDEFAFVNANISENTVSVYPSFICHESDLTGIQQSDGGVRTMTIVQKQKVKTNPVINYFFLLGNDASYSGMARCYRDYLLNKKVISKKVKNKTPAASFEAFGAASESNTFLGIKFNKMVYATTFKQLTDFEKKVNRSGIKNARYYLYGYFDGGYEGKTVTDDGYLRKLGGKKGYEKFLSVAGKKNVYTAFDIMCSYGKIFDFCRSNDYIKCLNQTAAEHHYKNPANGKWDTDLGSYKYYNIKKQQKYFSKLFKNTSVNSNIILSRMGQELPSDFSVSKTMNRDGFLSFYRQVFSKCRAKRFNLSFENGNLYSVSSAKEIHEVPLSSSNLKVESYSVPFYTMVFHGYKDISSTPVNDESDSDSFLLNAFEQGVSSTFKIAGCDGYLLKDTKLNFLYNADMKYNLKKSEKFSNDYNEIHSVLYNKCIVENIKDGNLSITEYENGWKIVCNYGEKSAAFDGAVVEPLSYTVIKP
ncbi:MAG: DUF5696 domain-containing protein [Clostridia bacterium]|nr:DUF5696 domain-containing protein [Clostridia bacterium]